MGNEDSCLLYDGSETFLDLYEVPFKPLFAMFGYVCINVSFCSYFLGRCFQLVRPTKRRIDYLLLEALVYHGVNDPFFCLCIHLTVQFSHYTLLQVIVDISLSIFQGT